MHKILQAAVMMFVLASCTVPPGHQETAARGANATFARLSEEIIAAYLDWRPHLGVALGLHQYDGRVTDYSRASLESELGRLKKFERRLERLNAAALNSRNRYDHRILQAAIRKEIFNFEELRIHRNNPMTYASALDVSIYVKRDFAPLHQRVASVVAILKEAPKTMAAARENLASDLAEPFVTAAIEVANGLAEFLAKDLTKGVSDISDVTLLNEFNSVNERAVTALRDYAQWLKTERLPLSHQNFALGEKRYRRMLAFGECITLSPHRILELGLQELRREQEIFAQTARQIDPTRDPVEVFRGIQRDHPTEEGLVADTRRNLELIREFVVQRRIVTVPSEVRARVEETPPFLRATSFASMDTPGPFETKATEAYYYVTPVEPHWSPQQKEEWLTAFNYYTTDVVSIHEAYPGHYTQFLCLNASAATRLEKIFTSYAFTEGWAHYTEQMMLEEGFGLPIDRPATDGDRMRALKLRLAQSDEALLRLCRLCVSVKMHCQRMTLDEATRFFQEHCHYEEKPARHEATRGSYDPEYLYYTLGKLQFLKLREDWKKQEGQAFSLQRFHDEALRHGAPPIRLLREVLLRDQSLWDEAF